MRNEKGGAKHISKGRGRETGRSGSTQQKKFSPSAYLSIASCPPFPHTHTFPRAHTRQSTRLLVSVRVAVCLIVQRWRSCMLDDSTYVRMCMACLITARMSACPQHESS